MFGSQQSKPPVASSVSPSTSTAAQSESAIARADRVLRQLRPGKSIRNRRNNYKPYGRSTSIKEIQKGLVLIDFQGDHPSEVVPFRDYGKLYDGCMRYRSDMREE